MKTLTPVLRKLSVVSVFSACFAWGQVTNSASFYLDVSANAANVIPHLSYAPPDEVIGPGHLRDYGRQLGPRQMERVAIFGF